MASKVTQIKFDVSGVDFKEAQEAGKGFKQPKPGVYKAKVQEFNPGFSKTDGKPDKSRPRVEVIFEIQDKAYKGAKLWYYLTFGEGFPRLKLAQFLAAYGLASSKKTKGVITAKEIKKIMATVVKIRVVGGKDLNGDYRGEVSQVLPADAVTDEDDVDDEDEDDEEEEDEEEDEEEEDEDEEDEEDEEPDYSEMEVAELRKELKSRGLGTKGSKPALIKRLQESDATEDEDEEDDEEDDGPF